MKAAGTTADGVVFPMGAQPWTADAGMKLVHDIAKAADPKTTYKPVHYVRGVCAYYYMKEAMEWADKNGGITGPNIKQGMYQKKDWVPAGLRASARRRRGRRRITAASPRCWSTRRSSSPTRLRTPTWVN